MTFTTKVDLKVFLQERREQIEAYLKETLKPNSAASRLWEAMAYSAQNGGKRLRGVLTLATAEALQPSDWQKVLPVAAGIECIHSMSLVHDDLPCMDDAELRRGKPTCHRAFDEATALLAGDALLVEGLALCLKAEIDPPLQNKTISLILDAVGARGMTGGQMIDLFETGKDNLTLSQLEQMHRLKTGALIKASVLAGAILVNASEAQKLALAGYAERLGLAFQIVDDLLDCEGDSAILGKQAGQDLAQNKCTYPKLLGETESRHKAEGLIQEAKESLKEAGIEFEALYAIADFVLERQS
ncbi:MAG: polyprenyl synthetase family protein [Candidatus Caenarcaniphilales bacterium]|nr:polyprenyl synthetase family protein [Candidatus Caenarcaniphilales bacterium]